MEQRPLKHNIIITCSIFNLSWYTAAQSPQSSLKEISKYHFNFCCQHQITYFISCPVKHRKATCRISFASVVRPCLSQRLARLPTDSFNYGQISDRFAVDSPHKSKSRDGCLAARSLEPARFTSWNMSQGAGTQPLFLLSVNACLQLLHKERGPG